MSRSDPVAVVNEPSPAEVNSVAHGAFRYRAFVSVSRVSRVMTPSGISSGIFLCVSSPTQPLMVLRASSGSFAKSSVRIPVP